MKRCMVLMAFATAIAVAAPLSNAVAQENEEERTESSQANQLNEEENEDEEDAEALPNQPTESRADSERSQPAQRSDTLQRQRQSTDPTQRQESQPGQGQQQLNQQQRSQQSQPFNENRQFDRGRGQLGDRPDDLNFDEEMRGRTQRGRDDSRRPRDQGFDARDRESFDGRQFRDGDNRRRNGFDDRDSFNRQDVDVRSNVDLGIQFNTSGDRLVVRDVMARRGIGSAIGLRTEDVIVSVDGRRITSPAQFERIIYTFDGRDRDYIPIIVMRGGRRVTLYYEPTSVDVRRQYSSYQSGDAWLGVTLDVRYDDRAIVQEVIPGSAADNAGIHEGDWIIALNDRDIWSRGQLAQMIGDMRPGEEVAIEIARRTTRTLYTTLGTEDRTERFSRRTVVEQPDRDIYYQNGQDRFYRDGQTEYRYNYDVDVDRNNRGVLDRFGPNERGLRDRLDRDQIRDEPRGLFPNR